MRGAHLFGYLDDTVIKPVHTDSTHAAWVAQDQSQVLGFINASLTREVLGHVATCTASAAVWKEITSMFTSQSRARMIQLRTCLFVTRKGEQSAATYYNKMKSFTHEMAAARKSLEDEDFISYVLAGLGQDNNSFVKNVTGKMKISLGSLYSQFLATEARLELQSASQYQSLANAAA
jgi:hypothetical protein